MAARHNNQGSALQVLIAQAQTLKADVDMAHTLAADADYWSERYPILKSLLHGDRDKGTAGLLALLQRTNNTLDTVLRLAQQERGE